MYFLPKTPVLAALFAALFSVSGFAQRAPQILQVTAPQLWQRLEFSITNVPAAANPFDPDTISLDATFTLPSGRTMTVPAFWYQAYQRSLSGGYEYDSPIGDPGWRLRFAPPETGGYSLSLIVRTNGQPYGLPAAANFTVPAGAPLNQSGYVRIAASKQYFETGDGKALRLIGEDVAWGDGPGTYSYDTWFANMQSAGENQARVWMCPWSCGIEDTASSLNNYSLAPAWDLDYVLQLAEQRGIYVLLDLDYDGMFATQPNATWGGNNYWPTNPYNVVNGGTCTNANDFFTNTTAQKIYQKRLRYLIARYGYSPNLLAWEFLNEIDNDYSFLDAGDVAAWHAVMGAWLHTNDVFGHLVTTSLTGGSDRPEIWTLPQLDFSTYHSYNEPAPALTIAGVAQSFIQQYAKPVIIGEFGTSSSGWNRTDDPYLRGFRQGIWGGAIGGTVGTSMSWWWENIDGENDYPVYSALGAILNRTGWGQGVWSAVGFQTAGTPPVLVGNLIPGGQPFNVQLPLNGNWGVMTPGQVAVLSAAAAGYSASALNAFVQGSTHPDLKTPFQLSAWFTNNARIVMHLNSVSDGAIMTVRVDGSEIFRTNLVNLDGAYVIDEEYNIDVPANLPAGKHLVEVVNAGNDWFFLDWVRLEQVLPAAAYSGNWQPSPDSIGLKGPRESLLYVVAPGVSFPANAANPSLPLQHAQTITLTNWPSGAFVGEWYDPATAASLGRTQAAVTNGSLTLPLPDFSEDLAAIVYPLPRLTTLGFDSTNGFQFRLDSETGGQYTIQKSADLSTWTNLLTVTNVSGSTNLADPTSGTNPQSFFRATKSN